jgi:hypothetical protein
MVAQAIQTQQIPKERTLHRVGAETLHSAQTSLPGKALTTFWSADGMQVIAIVKTLLEAELVAHKVCPI